MSNLKKQAVELFNNKDYKKSLSIFLSILKTNPKSKDILLYTSYSYMKMGDFKAAIIYFEKIVDKTSNISHADLRPIWDPHGQIAKVFWIASGQKNTDS